MKSLPTKMRIRGAKTIWPRTLLRVCPWTPLLLFQKRTMASLSLQDGNFVAVMGIAHVASSTLSPRLLSYHTQLWILRRMLPWVVLAFGVGLIHPTTLMKQHKHEADLGLHSVTRCLSALPMEEEDDEWVGACVCERERASSVACSLRLL